MIDKLCVDYYNSNNSVRNLNMLQRNETEKSQMKEQGFQKPVYYKNLQRISIFKVILGYLGSREESDPTR